MNFIFFLWVKKKNFNVRKKELKDEGTVKFFFMVIEVLTTMKFEGEIVVYEQYYNNCTHERCNHYKFIINVVIFAYI
jgi:hypothetical protein